MLSRLREHFGTAGLLIAIVALVAALGGGAIAATGGSGDNAEATASAKKGKKGKKGPRGPRGPKGAKGDTGPAGPQGPQGPAGARGANGSNGVNGANGAAGDDGATGPTGATGGNGSAGATGATGATGFSGFTETLPSGETETGSWSTASMVEATAQYVALTFAIPLATDIPFANVHAVPVGGPAPAGCTGGTALNPKADVGHLCVYASTLSNADYSGVLTGGALPTITKAGNPAEEGAGRTGAMVNIVATGTPGTGLGTFAVTAP